MNIDEALRILQLTEMTDKNTIKKQYRRLMGRFHPDAVGSDSPEHIKQAQLINEAYDFLKSCEEMGRQHFSDGESAAFAGKGRRTDGKGSKRRQSAGTNENDTQNEQHRHWQGMVNSSAFCERNIYQYYHLDDEEAENMYYQAAVGKYMWQPENEVFSLFIMSIHHAVKELMEDVESRAECRRKSRGMDDSFNPADAERKRFDIQARLFHLLTQQFVNPLWVMGQLSKPVKYDKEGRSIWHFRAWIGTKRRDRIFRQIAGLAEGELLYPKSFAGSRILVRNKEGQELGHLSFEEDWIYLCAIPLLKQKKAQVRMVSAGVEIREGIRPYAIKGDVDFYLRVEKEAVEYQPSGDLNLKIADLLIKYEQYLLKTN